VAATHPTGPAKCLHFRWPMQPLTRCYAKLLRQLRSDPSDGLARGRSRRLFEGMAKLYFHYSTMNAGKSTVLLQASHNYIERGMQTYLLTAQFDNRASEGKIASRIGIGSAADTFAPGEDLFAKVQTRLAAGPCQCIFIDEAQFLDPDQVWQLARAVDDLGVPIMAYGLRVDFMGALFPGSAALLALADEMREVRTICHCGKKATMVVRKDDQGNVLTDGDQVQIGGNETYISLCRRHWRAAMGDSGTTAR
jgi:thymidine kinase